MSFEETEEQLNAFPDYVQQGWESASAVAVLDKVRHIVCCGMGGSAIPGSLLSAYLETDTSMFVVRDYTLPSFVTNKDLVFVVSYSGNTEETISCFRSAMGKGCKIIGISSNGKLKQLCEKSKLDFIELPKGIQPRAALPLLFFPMLRVLSNSKLIEDQKVFVEATITALRKPIYREMAKALSEKLAGKIPLIYASQQFSAVAYRWKTQINENAKSMAFYHILPEMNHNELVGFENLIGDYYVVILQDEEEHPRIRKRMKLTKQLIARRGVSSTIIAVKGACKLSRIFSAIYTGDWTSVELAALYNIDPTPVHIIEQLKEMLKK